jgi:RimJ/RimL family protein N-acetyltransferase
LGLDYAMLRKPFLEEQVQKAKHNKGTINNVLVSFGGADKEDFTFKAVKRLIEINSVKRVNVILGNAYLHNHIYKFESEKLRIYKDLKADEMVQVMRSSDIAIVPASTVSIELAVLGVPMILGYFVDNQKNIYEGFKNKSSVKLIGDYNLFDFQLLVDCINHGFINENKVPVFNGNVRNNILRLFYGLDVKVRYVEEKDVDFIFNLSNEKLVRENSYNSNYIKYKDHVMWFNKQLRSAPKLFFIVEYAGKPAGQVRFANDEDHSIVGVSISEQYRGKSIAFYGLSQAIREYFKKNKKPVLAYIKKTNGASVKLFKQVGFRLYKEEKVNGVDSFVYIMRNNEN